MESRMELTNYEMEHPQLSPGGILMERLRARIARRPGLWRRRMRKLRERREAVDTWQRQAA